jgi:raffinose/stachyose/melibiose transport system substrate-binding protein
VTFKNIAYSNYSTALKPALASGTGPNVFDLQPGSLTALYGQFAVDLTPAVKAELGANWQSKVAPLGVPALSQNGELKGVSIGTNVAGTLDINQDLFNKYGVAVPKTMAQLQSACTTFNKNGIECLALGAKDEWQNQDLIQAIAGSVSPGSFSAAVNGKIKWTDPSIVQAFTIYKQFFTDKIVQEGALGQTGYPDIDNAWLTGKAAMIVMGNWNLTALQKAGLTQQIQAAGVASPKVFTALPVNFPDVAGKGNPPALFGDADYGLAVTKSAKNNQAAAIAFSLWLTASKQGQTLVANNLGEIPNLVGVTPDLNGLVDQSVQQRAIADTLAAAAQATDHREIANADLITNLQNALSSIATGQATPAAAAASLQNAK